jgi:hypothetical protein
VFKGPKEWGANRRACGAKWPQYIYVKICLDSPTLHCYYPRWKWVKNSQTNLFTTWFQNNFFDTQSLIIVDKCDSETGWRRRKRCEKFVKTSTFCKTWLVLTVLCIAGEAQKPSSWSLDCVLLSSLSKCPKQKQSRPGGRLLLFRALAEWRKFLTLN